MVYATLISIAAVVSFFSQTALAAPSSSVDINGLFVKRAASCTFPTPPKTSSLSAAKSITGTFDGGNVRYNRGAGACAISQKDGDSRDAVFILQSGATIQNVVIGTNQVQGIYCVGPCNIYNVWFEDVCESAIIIKQSSGTSNIKGGGARSADNEVVQHNGGGTVNIDSYCVQSFGKLYRSCGNCSTQYKRFINISNIDASDGKLIAGINSNYGDVATIATSSNTYKSITSVCNTYKGNNNGDEPTIVTRNTTNSYCMF